MPAGALGVGGRREARHTAVSQIRTVWSLPPVARRVPSGLRATARMSFSSWIWRSFLPVVSRCGPCGRCRWRPWTPVTAESQRTDVKSSPARPSPKRCARCAGWGCARSGGRGPRSSTTPTPTLSMRRGDRVRPSGGKERSARRPLRSRTYGSAAGSFVLPVHVSARLRAGPAGGRMPARRPRCRRRSRRL